MDVYEGRNLQTNEAVIIKSYLCEHLEAANAPLGEGLVQSRLEHPNICRLIDVRLSGPCRVHLIMEKLERDLLQDIRMRKKQSRPCAEAELIAFLRQTGSAIAFAKRKGIAHRDIKPENILLDTDNRFKLCDFGSSWQRSQLSMTNSPAGTLIYMSPQARLSIVSSSNKYNPYKADVYSLGVTALHYVNLSPPVRLGDEGLQSLVEEHLAQLTCSERVKECLRAMLNPQEDQRTDIEEVVNSLEDSPLELVEVASPQIERQTTGAQVERQTVLASCSTSKLFLLDCCSKTWQRVVLSEAVNVNKQTAYMVLNDGSVFCCGGNYLATAYIVKRDGVVLELRVMRESRSAPGIISIADAIYVFGGSEGNSHVAMNPKKSNEQYNASRGKWLSLPDMNCARCCFNPCTSRSRVFLCGGFDVSVEVFDPASKHFSLLAGIILPEASHCTAVCVEDKLMIITQGHCCHWSFAAKMLDVKKRDSRGTWSSSLPVVMGGLIYTIPLLWFAGCNVLDINTGRIQELISS